MCKIGTLQAEGMTVGDTRPKVALGMGRGREGPAGMGTGAKAKLHMLLS